MLSWPYFPCSFHCLEGNGRLSFLLHFKEWRWQCTPRFAIPLVLSASTLLSTSCNRSVSTQNALGFAQYVSNNYLQFFNAVLYASTPEMFDTAYRASASGMLSALGRIAGIVAPLAGQKFIDGGSAGILWLGAGGIWVSALFLCLLPIEMRGKQMY